MTKNLISINNLSKSHKSNNNEIKILSNLNFNLSSNQIISIVGPSGSGKSSFLNILGLLDSKFNGYYKIFDKNVKELNSNDKNIIRNTSIGFVHQFFHLIPELTVWENIAIPSLIKTNDRNKSMNDAKNLIENFELLDRINAKPNSLSGGEQQRVAIGRAMINKPKIIIADEMTGNLDNKTADTIFKFFIKQVKKNQQSLVFVTHNSVYSLQADIELKIENNNIVIL